MKSLVEGSIRHPPVFVLPNSLVELGAGQRAAGRRRAITGASSGYLFGQRSLAISVMVARPSSVHTQGTISPDTIGWLWVWRPWLRLRPAVHGVAVRSSSPKSLGRAPH